MRWAIGCHCLIFLLGANAVAGLPTPLQQTRRLYQDIVTIQKTKDPARKRTQASHLIGRYFDFSRFARLALENYWSKLTPKQRTAYVKEFFSRFQERAVDALMKTAPDKKFSISQLINEKKKGYAKVSARVTTPRRQTRVALYWTQNPKGWRIFDLDISKANLLANYKGQFNKIMREKGFEELLERLQRGEVR